MSASGLTTAYFSSGSGAPSGAPSVAAGEWALYEDTATGNLYKWSLFTTAWVAFGAGGGGSGAMTQIATGSLGSAAATIDLTSIAGTYNHLRLMFQVRLSEATTDDVVWLRLNGDSGSNYANEQVVASGAISGAGFNAVSKFVIGDLPANTGVAGNVGTGIVDLPFYAGTTFHKNIHSRAYGQYAATTGGNNVYNVDGVWLSTAAINELTLLLSTSTFAAGSTWTLYGIT